MTSLSTKNFIHYFTSIPDNLFSFYSQNKEIFYNLYNQVSWILRTKQPNTINYNNKKKFPPHHCTGNQVVKGQLTQEEANKTIASMEKTLEELKNGTIQISQGPGEISLAISEYRDSHQNKYLRNLS